MTQIYFYSGATDKLRTVCKISAKALLKNLKVVIYTMDIATIDQLDKLLWDFSATSFVPHARINDKPASEVPVVLGGEINQITDYDVLINLHDKCPPDFDRFQWLVEIAGISPEDKQAARIRYRFYKKNGYKITYLKLNN